MHLRCIQQFHAWYPTDQMNKAARFGRQHAWKFANNDQQYAPDIHKCASNLAHPGKNIGPKPLIFHLARKVQDIANNLRCLTTFCRARTN